MAKRKVELTEEQKRRNAEILARLEAENGGWWRKPAPCRNRLSAGRGGRKNNR